MPKARYLFPLDRWTLLVLAAATSLALITGWVDTLTPGSSMILFYFGAVCLVAWLVRGWWWAVLVVLCTVSWFIAQQIAPDFANLTFGTLMWNGCVRLFVFSGFGWLVARLRKLSRNPGSLTPAHDVTGLLSLPGLEEHLQGTDIAQRLRAGPIGLLLIDIERKVSAYRGHGVEHAALVAVLVSKTILAKVGGEDLCVRLSPNHYMVVMPQRSKAEAESLGDAIVGEFPDLRKTLDESFTATSLLMWADAPPPSLHRLRQATEGRLTQLKLLGSGRHHHEVYEEDPGHWSHAAGRA